MRLVQRSLSHLKAWSDGRPEEAIRTIRQKISEEPTNLGFKRDLADMLLGVGAFADVVSVTNEVLERDRKCVQSLFLRGEARERLGELKSAEKDYETCLDIDPFNLKSLYRLGMLRKDVELLSRAIDAVEETVIDSEQSEEKANLLYARGKVFTEQLYFDDALDDFERAIGLNEYCAPVYFGRGDVFLVMGEYLKALHNFDRFWELHRSFYSSRPEFDGESFSDSSVMNFCVKRAACYAGLSLWDSVIKNADIAIQIGLRGKHLAMAHFYRGKALEAQGNKKEAIEAYDLSLGFGHKLASAVERRENLLKN